MIKTQPEEITVCGLECLVMPNGDIICLGKIIGNFKDCQKYLTIKKL